MSDFKASKDAAQYLMSNLACSICEDLPGSIADRKNRYACCNGHIVCEKCILDKCSCESETFSGPLSLLKKMIEESTWHYCCNFKRGCLNLIEAGNLDEHQKTCIYRQIICPGNETGCHEQVSFKDILDHVENDHKDWNNAAKGNRYLKVEF